LSGGKAAADMTSQLPVVLPRLGWQLPFVLATCQGGIAMSARGVPRSAAIVFLVFGVGLVVSRPIVRGEPATTAEQAVKRDTKPGAAAKRDGNAWSLAMLTGDFDTLVNYTHPALVQRSGGKDKLIGKLRKASDNMRAEGYRIVESSVAEPLQIVRAGDEMHAVLPLKEVIVRAKHGELHSSGYLLGVSRDDGRTWKFINGSALTEKDVREMLPNYNRKLRLPAHNQPTFVPK
jgi:hypothetical protein